MRKPHPQSKLKTLDAKAQERIRELLNENTLATAVELVKEKFAVATSQTALSNFRTWYDLCHEISDSAELAEAVKELLSDKKLKLAPETVSQAAQIVFENRALKRDDGNLFVALRVARQNDKRLEQNERKLKLEIEKFQTLVLEKSLDLFENKKLRDIAESSAPRADKIAALRKAAFADIDELEKSGKVELPQ